jgi:hypothetical protein
MPRPDDFTAETQARCDAEMEQYRRQQRADPASVRLNVPDAAFADPRLREAWYCGVWLFAKLAAAGCCEEAAREVCRENGGRLLDGDPWETTRRTLAAVLANQGG